MRTDRVNNVLQRNINFPLLKMNSNDLWQA